MFNNLRQLVEGDWKALIDRETEQRASKKRRRLVRFLKSSIQTLVIEHAELSLCEGGVGENEKGAILTEEMPWVKNLLVALEQCIFHGMKFKEQQDMQRLWILFEQASSQFSQCSISKIRKKIEQRASINRFSSYVGRVRAWIRHALVDCTLRLELEVIAKREGNLSLCFENFALLANPEDCESFLILCGSLSNFSFNLNISNPELDEVPSWIHMIGDDTLCGLDSSTSLLRDFTDTSDCEMDPILALDSIRARDALEKERNSTIESSLASFFSLDSDIPLSTSWVSRHGGGQGTQTSPMLSPLAVSVSRETLFAARHEGKSRDTIFGVDLEELFCNPRRSSSAMLDAAADLPDGLHHLLKAIAHPLVLSDTSLFELAPKSSELVGLMKVLNSTNKVPMDAEGSYAAVSPQALVSVLLLFLRKMPQPLLTYQSYDAFLAVANDIGEGDARNRNLRHLVEELPWPNRPLLLHLLVLFNTFLQPHYSAMNNLTIGKVAKVLAPNILRPANAASAEVIANQPHSENVVAVLLSEHEYILAGIKAELELRRQRVSTKIARVQQLQRMYSARVYLKRDGAQAIITSIWVRLEPTEAAVKALQKFQEDEQVGGDVDTPRARSTSFRKLRSASNNAAENHVITSMRWVTCGMCKDCNTIADEIRSVGNIFALDCLNYLLLAFPLTSAHLFASDSPAAATFYAPVQVTMLQKTGRIASIVSELLNLAPLANEIENPRAAALRLAGTRIWRLFKHKYASQDLFCAGMLLCDAIMLHMKHISALEGRPWNDVESWEHIYVKMADVLNSALQRRPTTPRKLWTEIESVSGIALCVDPRDVKSKKAALSYVCHNRTNQQMFDDLENALGISPLAVESVAPSSFDEDTQPGPRDEDGGRSVLRSPHKSPQIVKSGNDGGSEVRNESPVIRPPHGVSFDFNDTFSYDPAPRVTEEKALFIPPCLLSPSNVLSSDNVYALGLRLPRSVGGSDWKLLFSLERHGASLSTLLSHCANAQPTLVVISDSEGTVFGGFAAGASWINQGASSFFGNGESFLFSFLRCKGPTAVRIWRWAEQVTLNGYFLFSDPGKGIGMGGGGGKGEFGWYVDESLACGTSGSCDTFRNDCLSSKREFSVMGLEVWTFVPSIGDISRINRRIHANALDEFTEIL